VGELRQLIVRRLRLLLTVWLLALAWAPAASATDVTLHATVVQIATARPALSAPALRVSTARPARAARVTVSHRDLALCAPCALHAVHAAHGPAFDGRTLYLEFRSLLR
jgi:hypothetical protein